MRRAQIERGPGYLVKRVQQNLRRRCDAALKPIGLSMSQYAVLRALHDHPDASASELARLCFVTRQSVRDVLGGLTAAGLVALSDHQARGRAQALQLTPLGLRRLKSSHAAVEAVEAEMLHGIPASARKQLAGLLERCAENLEAAPDEV
ncbi:MarR family winged helix-turn-helix transcriptional regulator [Mycobacterium palustre]|uniref:MarR family transcriptional regulator n=1 Tax=Mycobacterium palustre TaxID=153971 RepID=A0A1X1ZTI5_9MYCO|nr:MarR family transcriptional regulator [Mycobacterium palustre]MCV7102651.1 MarR family transcriptional regulator [Mycobacterium palustre]ORW26750.1 MarR family transcriptional regulator [Mycobacterium palustre]